MTHVLVIYASRHGGTRGIAERIATTLRREGLRATVAAVQEVPDPAGGDACVIGSGVYFGNWLKEAKRYVKGRAKELREKPVWLFSSGPVGPPSDDAKRDALLPRSRAELESWLKPRGHVVFSGAFDPADPPRSIGERVMRALPASKGLLPPGDYRDWDAIDAWARSIARELAPRRGRRGR